jgi:cell division control protein 6
MDIFEELLNKPTIFIDEGKLDINYVPNKLPHRNKEISLLSQLFLTLLTNPNEMSRKILIIGKIGVGKTVTVKLFGELLLQAAVNRNLSFAYIHINCRKERTSYKVLIKIIRTLNKDFPKRGYSPQDLLDIIIDHLTAHNVHILVILDELNYLINNDNDLIYALTRLNEECFNAPQRISLIGIVRDLSSINILDNSTLSTLQRNIIKFDDYSKEQIFDILQYRAEISLRKNAISNQLIEMISEIVYKNGDVRYGLNLLWKAGKIAENKNLITITLDCIKLANQEMVPFSAFDFLNDMSSQKLIFIYAIIIGLKKTNNLRVSFMEILKPYHMICENLGLKPRSYSQLWNYLQECKRDNLLSIKMTNKNTRGRKALIEILEIDLKKLEDILKNMLKSKGIDL